MRKQWSEEEVTWLKENYPVLGLVECSKVLGLSQSAVLHKAWRLQLKRRGEGRADRVHLYDGYAYLSKVNDRRAIHRMIMEQHLGRPLTSDEVVHHKDGNVLNNSLDNLELHTRSSHMKLHNDSRPRDNKGRFIG